MEKPGIVAFAFGVPYAIGSNQRIAQIASQKARELEAPVYTQADIRVDSGIVVEYTIEEQGNPPPTLRMARGAVQWAKRQGLIELWIVAAKPHLWRVFRDLEEAVRELGDKMRVRACKEIERFPYDSWFCPDSAQARTRSRAVWGVREKILKLMPFWLYKHIAK